MKKSLLLLVVLILGCSSAFAQAVSGIVYDEYGQTLPGVTVMVVGASTGTVTDFDGNFSLSASADSKLTFSFIGYKSTTVNVKGQSNLKVTMNPDVVALDEVVAVGYGSRKKVNLIGAVESVATDDLSSRSLTNAGQALQGKLSGVIITQSSGQPGDDAVEIRIRGVSSIENSNDPLVIIDGVEGSLSDIHASDIESMSVLKDASSAAIYGNRAAAGVIIINTKSGTAGKLKLNARFTSTLQEVTTFPEVASGYDYAVLKNEARLNSGYPNVPYTDEKLQEIKDGSNPSLQDVDLNEFYFAPAFMQNSNISITGGEKNYNFAFMGGYLDQDGVLYGTSANQATYRAKLNAKFFNNKLRLGAVLGGYTKDESELSSNTASVLAANSISAPIGFIQSDNGEWGGKARYIAIQEEGGGTTINKNSLNYQMNAELEPVKGLRLKALYSQTHYSYSKDRLAASVALAGNVFEDEADTYTTSEFAQTYIGTNSSTFSSTVDYNAKFGNHRISALLGYEYLTYYYDNYYFTINDLTANEPHYPYGDPETLVANSNINESATMSYFMRMGYDYHDKYLFEFNLRRDGSSRFSSKNRWGTFPSLSAGWRISEESFMDDTPVELKLRGSWGQLGNERMSDYYPIYDQLAAGEYYSFGGSVVQGTGTKLLGNENLEWEVSTQTNIGIDAVLYNDYTVTANVFNKVTSGILGRQEIPNSLGLGNTSASIPYQNIGVMVNRGIELSLEYQKQWGDWRFSANANVSYLQNEVIDLGGLEYVAHDAISGYSPASDIIRSQVGYAFGSYFGYIADGIYQIDDFTWQGGSDPSIAHLDRLYTLKEGMDDPSAVLTNAQPGDIKYKDVTNDDKITKEDISYMGSSQPDYIFSLQFYVQYKNWSLSALGSGVQGSDSYLMGALVSPFWSGAGNITQDIVDNHWSLENQSTTHQRVYDDSQRCNIVSSYYLYDSSYFRLKNIELAYTFSNLDKYLINDLRISASVENAFLWSYMDGFH